MGLGICMPSPSFNLIKYLILPKDYISVSSDPTELSFLWCLTAFVTSIPHSHKHVFAAAVAKSLQSCPTLCDPVPGILQARTLEWVAISFSNA